MLSDLDSVWWEEMTSDNIRQRSQELNKRLKAPVPAFFRHLRDVMEPMLSGTGRERLSGFTSRRLHNQLHIQVRSELSGVPFYWAFHCSEAPISMVTRHMVCPLLGMVQALQRQSRDLVLLIARKDAEILDYRENGAALTRDRLETEIFDEGKFKERFLAEGLPEPVTVEDAGVFSSELQQLYTAVTATEANQRAALGNTGDGKTGHSELRGQLPAETREETEPVTSTPGENSEIKPKAPSKRPASGAGVSPRTESPVAKQRKRKGRGIFG
ncbi:non-homologous end-joining factor 1 [Callorhinchus milii]|uniref:non-homologous end-joining factor 1 n=1 Tax=Callorhinchus milii TaxID=7868 RepID=UPI0004571BFD|nr:non-homologous end-joining factor 1 [Callorhinchus milii]|eukprot:gi/632987364/ref/XP_007910746.1/ PREDICTED: non-homologous end-joining factor 1-like [Callorhinchus milii]